MVLSVNADNYLTENTTMEVQNAIENISKVLIGDYGWMFIVAFVGLMFKDFVNNTFQGIATMIGNDINPDDIVYISGRQARVVRVGMRKTIFYMTDRGTKMIVPNDRLKYLVIEKTLPKNGGYFAKGPEANLKKQIFDGNKYEEKT